MKNIYILIIYIIIFIGCNKNETRVFKETINNYMIDYPINIDNYNYVVRFYKLEKDTIFEINQDRIDFDTPVYFTFNSVEKIGGKKFKRFIFIGKIYINNKSVFLFDTRDSIGKNFYRDLKIFSNLDTIEKINDLNYPFIPKTRIYKLKNNTITLVEERDTLNFK